MKLLVRDAARSKELVFEARFLDKSGENDENIVVENESPESPEKPEEVRAENVPYEKCRWDFFLSLLAWKLATGFLLVSCSKVNHGRSSARVHHASD